MGSRFTVETLVDRFDLGTTENDRHAVDPAPSRPS
jgi:hypothetical protein